MDSSDPREEGRHKCILIDALFKGELLALTQQLQPNETSGAGLLDLPNEILLLLLEHVELDWDLFIIASLSKRLHYLALPLFFARNGVSPFAGELILFDSRSYAVLRALSIALFKPALKCLRCTFDFAKPRNICRLRHLVESLSWIEEVYVNFMDTTHREASPPAVKPTEWGPVAAKELCELFSTIIGKGVRITIYDTMTWYAESTTKELATIGWKQLSRYTVKSTASTAWNAVQTIWSPWRKCETHPLPTLSFNLHCAMLFHATFFPWTIKTLNGARLSTLSLQQLRMDDDDKWAAILPPLVMPNLSNLTLDSCSIPFSALIKFLSRHPQITHLYLGRDLAMPSLSSDRLPIDTLPRLIHLSTTSQYLLHLLAPKTSLPSLRSVSMITRIPHGRYFDFRVMNDTLRTISHRLTQIEFSLEVSFLSSSDNWMLLDVAPDQRQETVMQHVSKLDLRVAMYRLPRDIITSLPRWLMLFPSLKCVTLLTLTREWPMDLVDRVTFIRSIQKWCPWIETVGMNDFVHSIEVWQKLFR